MNSQLDTSTSYLRGRIMDKITEEKIDQVCDLCATAIRFEIDTNKQEWKKIDLIVYTRIISAISLITQMVNIIYAKGKRSDPQALILPSGNHSDEGCLLRG
jgi:hypothetical protein